ncbi:MAG TPA: SDR family NAD(P)-dependent oxidoreductase, partial [Nitriliruptorales bacterium]
MDLLEGRTAVVTGAANGIGLATAHRLARVGMGVVLADIDRPRLEQATAELRTAGHQVLAVPTDVSDASQVDALAGAAWDTFGAVHLLCNNAGVGWTGPLWTATPNDWAWVLGVNLDGTIRGIRSFVPRMLEEGAPGHIVNLSSMAGLAAPPGLGPYAASKHAVVGLSESLAHDLQGVGAPISVTVICPGVVATDIANAERHRPDRFTNPTPAPSPTSAPDIDPTDPSLGVLVPISP